MLYLAGKLGGVVSSAADDRAKLTANLESQIAELRMDRDLYRDLILEQYPHRTASEIGVSSEPPAVEVVPIRVKNWGAARGIMARAAKDKRDREKDPIHRVEPKAAD